MPKGRQALSRRCEAKVRHVAPGRQRDRLPPMGANRRAQVQNTFEIAADRMRENCPSPSPMPQLPAQQFVSREVQTHKTGNGDHEHDNLLPEHVIWIVGSSIPYWANRRAANRSSVCLGLKDCRISWFTRRGMAWPDVLPLVSGKLQDCTYKPDIIIIHSGGNSIGKIKQLRLLFNKTVGKKRNNREYEVHHGGYFAYKADVKWLEMEYRQKMKGIDESKVSAVFCEFMAPMRSYETLLVFLLNGREGNRMRRMEIGVNATNVVGKLHNEQPTEKELSGIAKSIGNEYRHVGFELGLEKARIEQICQEDSTTRGRTTSILCEWKKRNANKATFGGLYKALMEAGSDTNSIFQNIMKMRI